MRIAFLGLGRMGRAMARHVLAPGHQLVVWNRTAGKADDLVAAGAQEAPSLGQAVRDADVVVCMLFGPDAVREVLARVAEAIPAGTLVVDATTNGARAAREFAAFADAHGFRYLEAPVAGSLPPAEEGTLTVLAGGSEQDYAEALPLLMLWGDPDRVRRVGELGAGNALKTVINLTLGLSIASVGEALRLGHDLGPDRDVLIEALAQGPLGFTVRYKRSMLASGEYTPAAFTVEAMRKDLGLALDSARHELPLTAAAARLAQEAVAAGHGEDDFAALAAFTPGRT